MREGDVSRWGMSSDAGVEGESKRGRCVEMEMGWDAEVGECKREMYRDGDRM